MNRIKKAQKIINDFGTTLESVSDFNKTPLYYPESELKNSKKEILDAAKLVSLFTDDKDMISEVLEEVPFFLDYFIPDHLVEILNKPILDALETNTRSAEATSEGNE